MTYVDFDKLYRKEVTQGKEIMITAIIDVH
jgi:hypothetical protein